MATMTTAVNGGSFSTPTFDRPNHNLGILDPLAAQIQQREEARATRDWSTADALREAIRNQGFEVEDTPSGTRWRRIGR